MNEAINDIALYRKYRPQNFAEVIGQEEAVRVLKATIEKGKIAHAYLFAGSRGTGKTSLARIFAKEIGTSPSDLSEIDAASNRGIDDIRALRESVSTLPFDSKFKVYIIDEAHMLTKEAWNALLKTLEEPPAHAVFILATTETDKVPETVVSRCQVFSFRKPSQATLKEVVQRIGKKEGFEVDAGAAELVALLGDGSFRDTLGILQKILGASAGKKVTAEQVEAVTAAPRHSLVNDAISAIAEKNLEKALGAVRNAASANIDMKVYCKLLLQKLRFALLLRVARDMEGYVKASVSEEDFAFLKETAGKENGITSAVLVELLGASELMGRSFLPELPLELAFIRLFSTEAEQSLPAGKR